MHFHPPVTADLATNASREQARADLMENDPLKAVITGFQLDQRAPPIQSATAAAPDPIKHERARAGGATGTALSLGVT